MLPTLIPSSDNEALAFLRACISPACFWPPEQILSDSAWLEHAPFAFWLMGALRPRTFVELGTHSGFSYFAFCQAVQRLQLETRCYAVDTWKGDEHAGFYGEEVFREVCNQNDRRYSAFSSLIHSSFDDASRHFADGSIDLLHIDGRHFFDDVKHDFETWRAKLSNRAVVLFHDTNVRERDFGVFRFWNELRLAHPHFEFSHGHGLGVLGIGKELPDQVFALFAAQASVEANTYIQRAYSRLGSAVTFQFRAEHLQITAERQIAGLTGALSERDGKVAALDQTLAERDRELGGVRDALTERDANIAVLDRTLAEREAKVAALDQTLAERDRELGGVRDALTERDANIAVLDRTLAEREAKVAALDQTLAERDRELGGVRDALTERDANIAVLDRTLAEREAKVAALDQTLAERDRELGGVRDALTERDANIAVLQSTISALRASTSWRITAPLRFVKRLLGRFRHSAVGYLLTLCWQVLRTRSRAPLRDWRATRAIARSGLLDSKWYLRNYPDVAASGIDPICHYIIHGAREGRDPSPSFSTLSYLSHNPDVEATGLNPLFHFIRHGANEGRATTPVADETNRLTSFDPFVSVVYVSGTPDIPSHFYRVEHQVNALNAIGVTAGWVPVADIARFENSLVFADMVVLFRVAWSEELSGVIEKCRRAGASVLFDIDDYVFDPDIAVEKYIDGIRFVRPEHRKQYFNGIIGYRQTLQNVDECIFSTQTLAVAAQVVGKPAHILPNGFDAATADRAAKIFDARIHAADRRSIRIGYASGTLTHQKDFAVAAPALARVLKENAATQFTIVGELLLDEFPELDPFRDRIEMRPRVPIANVVAELGRFDINLAPLQVGNPFCEAKSNLKYFEAALMGVPTVASPTEPYRVAIRHGNNGYLAAGGEDWYRALTALVRDPHGRREMGRRAREDSLASYGPQAKSYLVQDLFGGLLAEKRKRVAGHGAAARQRVLVVLPPMIRGSGGHAKAISIAKGLADRNYSVVINFLGGSRDYAAAGEIEKEFDLNGRSISAVFRPGVPCDADIVIATFWATVFAVEQSGRSFGRRYKLVQDYEPLFYPMGSEHLQAIAALKRDFKKIAYGPWLVRMLSSRLGLDARAIPFYIDKALYRPHDGSRDSRMLVVFARPEMPRRCFDITVKALARYAEKYGRRDTIVLFGSTSIDPASLPFRCESRGIMTPKELAALYSRGTLGLAFSSTNPSMVSFEMMACGMPVLDLDLEGVMDVYGSSQNVFLAAPEPDLIADRIAAIMADEATRHEVAANGRAFVANFPDECEAIDVFARYLEADSVASN